MIGDYWTADKFLMDITVEEDGAAKDLTGATVEAVVGGAGTNTAVTAALLDAANGIIRVSWAASTLQARAYTLQVRATIGGDTQTVHEESFTPKQSLIAA